MRTTSSKHKTAPLQREDLVKNIHCPFAHVRYKILLDLWNGYSPKVFLNNEIPAKVVMADFVQTLHVDREYNGEVGARNNAVTYAYSAEPLSGKSTAATTGQALIGMYEANAIGGDVTKAGIIDRQSLFSNLLLVIDDMIPTEKDDGQRNSRQYQQLIRAQFDRTTRVVSGKARTSETQIMMSSNYMMNDGDKAFHTRILYVPFSELDKSQQAMQDDPVLFSQFNLLQEMLSCLTPDLACIGIWEGKLDKEAILDFNSFLCHALGRYRDRNCHEWAKRGFYYVQLCYLAQDLGDGIARFLEWLISTMTMSIYEVNHITHPIDILIKDIIEVRENIGANVLGPNPDKVIHWHNVRESEYPDLGNKSIKWVAVRVEKICNVIKNADGEECQTPQIWDAAKSYNFAMDGRTLFYDADKAGWPAKYVHYDEEMHCQKDIPLAENELTPAMLTRQRCLFIHANRVKQIREMMTGVKNDMTDVTKIQVRSTLDGKYYNFYDKLTSGGWFGYRSSLHHPNWRLFHGNGNNMLHCGSPMEPMHVDLEIEMDVLEKFGMSVQRLSCLTCCSSSSLTSR